MHPALLQRLIIFSTYFFGFLVLDRLSFFGDPPSITETFVMALVLGLAVTLLSPMVANLLGRLGSGPSSSRSSARGRRSDVTLARISGDRMTRDSVDADLGL